MDVITLKKAIRTSDVMAMKELKAIWEVTFNMTVTIINEIKVLMDAGAMNWS